MALVLIKEDGSGKSDANTYALVADGNAYHEGHLYASAWTAAATANKEAALVMATRVLDALFQFNGLKVTSAQALQWPRQDCPDPDGEEDLDETQVPAAVPQATCELARTLLQADRTADPEGTGLRTLALEGSMTVVFDTVSRQPVLTEFLQILLSKYGTLLNRRGGTARLVRT